MPSAWICSCSGVGFSSAAPSSPASRPISVDMPVSVTTSSARPRTSVVFMKPTFTRSASGTSPVPSIASSSLSTGTDSPVSIDSSTEVDAVTTKRPSAGTRSPASSSTTSPGTSAGRRHLLHLAAPAHPHDRLEHALERRQRVVGLVLLDEAHDRVDQQHDADDDRVLVVTHRRRDRRRPEQDVDHQVLELVERTASTPDAAATRRAGSAPKRSRRAATSVGVQADAAGSTDSRVRGLCRRQPEPVGGLEGQWSFGGLRRRGAVRAAPPAAEVSLTRPDRPGRWHRAREGPW